MTAKNTKVLATAIVLMMTIGSLHADPVDGRDVVHSKRNDVFAFTTDRTMRRGELQVYYSNGEMLVSERTRRRRIMIDFAEVRKGTYTIVVLKNGVTKEFQYEKR